MRGEPIDRYNKVSDNFIKALLIDENAAEDDYIKLRVANSINKKIRDAYMGRLLIQGTYQPIIADPYGFCQYIFGLEITGLIPEGNCYNKFYLDRREEHVCALRSPMTWRSEVNGLVLYDSPEAAKWYSYITNGQIQSLWGVDNMLQSGSDFDGDCVFITPNECFWNCRCNDENRGVPVTYEPQKAQEKKIVSKKLYGTDVLAFDPLIGMITNVSTTIYEIQSRFEPGTPEYKECETRLKLCCTLQSMGIDAAKGIAFEGIPKHWLKQSEQNCCIDNKIAIGKRRPYFMRYLYSHKNAEYTQFRRDVERMYNISFGGKNIQNLPNATSKNTQIEEFISRNNPLLETNGTMNRICRYMESRLSEIKALKKSDGCENFAKKLFNADVATDLTLLSAMEQLYDDYCDFKSSKALQDSEYNSYEQFYVAINRRAYDTISTNSTELVNLAVHLCYTIKGKKAKSFVWDCFGAETLENLVANERKSHEDGCARAVFPCRCEDGEIEYLGKKYTYRTFLI